MEYLLISLSLLVCVLLIVLFKQSLRSSGKGDQSLMLVQQQVESLRSDVRSSLQHITENVNKQLALVTQQIQSQTNTVGSHLDTAHKKYDDANKRLTSFEGRLENITDHPLPESHTRRILESERVLP